jgi:surface antigen
MKTLEQFISDYDGKFKDFDGIYPNQCKDLFSYYNREVVGNLNYVIGDAKNLLDNAPIEYYERVGVPMCGDIIVWGTGIGEYGHVAIFLYKKSDNEFVSFDQNFPKGTPCHKQTHNYKNIIGYLRPKGDIMDLQKVIDLLVKIFSYLWRLGNKMSNPDMNAIRNDVTTYLNRWMGGEEWAFSELINNFLAKLINQEPIIQEKIVEKPVEKIVEKEVKVPKEEIDKWALLVYALKGILK